MRIEVLANTIIQFVTTNELGIVHRTRMYSALYPTKITDANTGSEDVELSASVGGASVGLISELMLDYMTRINTVSIAGTISSLEVQIPSVGENLLLAAPSWGGSYEGGIAATNVRASSQLTYTFTDSAKRQYRHMLFDAQPQPQRFLTVAPPVVDDLSVAWFFVRSRWDMCNRYGGVLSRWVGASATFNSKLERRYGKAMN